MAIIKYADKSNDDYYIGLSTDDRSGVYNTGAKLFLLDTKELLRYYEGQWYDYFQYDNITKGIRTITTDHSSIHSGEAFSISGIFVDVANGAAVNYAFKTPTVESGKYIHLKFSEFTASGNKIRVDLYEAPTNEPVAGADLVAYNRRRTGTPVTSSMQAIKANNSTVNLLNGATMISSSQFISNSSRPLDIEWILKPDTWYIRHFTNFTGQAADISFFEFFYEED